jgi:hypothetical protein
MNLGELGRMGWREVGARWLGSIYIGWVDGSALLGLDMSDLYCN